MGLSLSRPLLLRGTGSRRAGSAVVAHGPSHSAAREIFRDQGSNPRPLHWQARFPTTAPPGKPYYHFFIVLWLLFCYLQGGNWRLSSLQARLLTSTIYIIFSNPSWLAQSSLGLGSCLPTPHPGLLGGRPVRLSYGQHLSAPAHRSRAPPLRACILPAPLRPTRHTLPEAARSSGRAHLCRPWVTTRHGALTHHGWFAGAQESSTSKVGAPGREWPEDLSILQGPLAHELLIYWKKGVWDLSS